MKIGIIIGSVRDGRIGEAVAEWVLEQSASQQGTEFEIVDVLDHDLPFVAEERLPAMVNDAYANEKTTAFGRKIAEFDAYIFVTAEYNHGMPGPFKNAYDLLGVEWTKTAVAFVGYGAAGGVRAVDAVAPGGRQRVHVRHPRPGERVDLHRSGGRQGLLRAAER